MSRQDILNRIFRQIFFVRKILLDKLFSDLRSLAIGLLGPEDAEALGMVV